MKKVINDSPEKVEAYFNGQYIRFKAGQKKLLEDGVADEIVRENEALVFKVTAPAPVEEAPVEEAEPVIEKTAKKPAKKK